MMNCSEVERQILSGEALTEEAQAHLLSCKDCQAYSLGCLVGENRVGEPSRKVDYVCSHLLVSEDKNFSLRARGRAFLSIAAALLVLMGIMSYVDIVQKVEVEDVAANEPELVGGEEDWMLLADKDLELLELSMEDEKEPLKQLYNEIALLEVDYYVFY